MPVVEKEWIASDGTALRMKSWLPKSEPAGRIVGLHGLNCTSDDWLPLAEAANARGVAMEAWNLRGQGLDPVESRRGAWLDVDGMIADLADFLGGIELNERRVFLAGDSMGALLALRAAADPRVAERVAGVLLFVPVVALAQRNPPWVKNAIGFLSRALPAARVNPGWFVHGRANTPKLTRDKARQAAFEAAPHRIRRQTLGFLVAMGDLIESSAAAAEQLKQPAAVFSAGHDAFVRPEDVEVFFRAIRSADKTHFHYPDSYHQLLHDLDAERVTRDAVEWIAARL